MPKCVLCGAPGADIPLNKDAHSSGLLDRVCADCKADVDRLFDLAENADDKAYAEYRNGFAEDFGQTETVKDLLRIADARKKTAAANKRNPAQTKKKEAGSAIDPINYYPNKLMLCTLIGLAALFTSVLGLIPSFIGFRMSKELPPEVSPPDVLRARRLCLAALIINTVETVGAIITALVLAFTL